MSEPSAIWMFLSILAICITWYKVATESKRTPADSALFLLNGQPLNGSIELTRDGKISRFKVVDGRIA
jgi:hypothetical protein